MNEEYPKLLIVDDDEINRNTLCFALDEFELEIHEAVSGPDALKAALRYEYCLILMGDFETTELVIARLGLKTNATLRLNKLKRSVDSLAANGQSLSKTTTPRATFPSRSF